MASARQFLASCLSDLDFKVQFLPAVHHPAVFASRIVNPSYPTVLIYGHYDVQPPGAPSQWTSPPFDPTIRKGRIYARGASDDKGQLMIHLAAVSDPAQQVNFKIFIEGEEEIGSPSIADQISAYPDLFACDFVLVSDTEMVSPDHPSIDICLRGCLDVELSVTTGTHDLHSGQFGGLAPNPAVILTQLLGNLKNGLGKITLPGFYDQVHKLPGRILADFHRIEPLPAQILSEGKFFYISPAPKNLSINDRRWLEPTLDITGLDAGFTGHGTKTIIPDSAMAKISFRLVPHQNPDQIYTSLRDYFHHHLSKNAVFSIFRYPDTHPYLAPIDHPVYQLAKTSLQAVYGHNPVFVGQGGSIGFVPEIASRLHVPVVMLGFGLADENVHSPNEHFSLANFSRGIAVMNHFYTHLDKKSLFV
jgi:amidohydrolase